MVDLKESLLREHLTKATKVALHPLRRKILKFLKGDSSLSTVDLIEKLNLNKDDRYNLYHHLNILEKFMLIKKDKLKTSGKLIFYKMNNVKNPIIMAYSFDSNEIKDNKDKIYKILDKLGEIENHKIKNRNKIKTIEINISFK